MTGIIRIETYRIEFPQYDWKALEELPLYAEPDEEMEQAVGEIYFEQLEAAIGTPQLSEPYGMQYFYTLGDKDKLLMFSRLTNQYFLLERCEEASNEELPEWTEEEKEDLLQELYGEYQVMEFLPTKYYPASDSNGCAILPEEEAGLMIGNKILIEADCFVTYDNYRRPNSYIAGRSETEFRLERAEVQNPRYDVKSVRSAEIYGIDAWTFAEETDAQTYVEIDAYPGYETNGSKMLPQLFLLEDGRLVLYSMGEYFLLEKIE